MLILITDDGARLLPVLMKGRFVSVVHDHGDLFKVYHRGGFIISLEYQGPSSMTLLAKAA